MKHLLLAVLTAVLMFGHAQAANPIYVSPTGNDTTGNGTQSNPYKTPDRARQAVAAIPCNQRPVSVYFASGFYPLASTWTFTSADSGCSSTETVTYTSQPGNATTPVISGGIIVNQANGYTWTNVSGTSQWWVQLASAQFPSGFSPEALFYNGVRRFRARAGAIAGAGLVGAYYRVANPVSVCGSGGTSVCYDRFKYTAGDPLDSAASWLNYQPSQPSGQNNPCTPGNANQAGDIEILVFEYWTVSRERISCVDATNHIAYLEGNTQTNSNHGYIAGHRYVVENVYTGASNLKAGQYFFDRTTYKLYYMANSGENPNTDTVVIPVLTPSTSTGAVLSATNLSYVTFSALQFSHDNYVPGSAGFAAVQSNTNLPAMVTCQDCSHTTWSGNTFTQTTGNALWLSTSSSSTATPTGNTITGNYIYDVGSDGIVYGNLPRSTDTATNILQNGAITENIVQGYGRMYPGASGIEHPFGSTTDIENNDVTDGYNTGIGVCVPNNGGNNCGGTSGGAVASNITGSYNHVWNIGKGVTDDMGAFYIATYQATGNVVNNNRLHDVQDAQTVDSDGYGGNGLYFDNQTGVLTAENNVVFRVTEHAVQNTQGPLACGQSILVQNNILAYARTGMFNQGNTAALACLTVTLQNNLFYFDRTDTSSCGIGQNSNQCAFYVPSGCTVLNSNPNQNQHWIANLYWNTALSTWGTTYGKAFFTISSYSSCGSRTFYTFPGWQGLGQDSGSAVFSPAFANPTCSYSTATACLSHTTQDNYRITGYPAGSQYPITSGNYFTTFCMGATTQCTDYPGRLNPTFTPGAVLDTFVTTLFDTTSSAGNF